MAAALVEVAAIKVSGSTTVRHVSSADTMTRSSWAACHPLMGVGDGVVLGVAVAVGDDDAAVVLRRVSSSSSSRPTVEVSH